jgi:hypothetical protein
MWNGDKGESSASQDTGWGKPHGGVFPQGFLQFSSFLVGGMVTDVSEYLVFQTTKNLSDSHSGKVRMQYLNTTQGRHIKYTKPSPKE